MCGSRVSLSPAPAPSGSLYSRLWSPPAVLCNVLPPETGLGHWAMCIGAKMNQIWGEQCSWQLVDLIPVSVHALFALSIMTIAGID